MLKKILFPIITCALITNSAIAQLNEIPSNGISLEGTESFDNEIKNLLKEWNVPGASIAVAKNGKLILAKGYGFADKTTKKEITNNSVSRVGSITKTLTAVITFKLIEKGQLNLDDKILPILERGNITPLKIYDERIKNITVRHLLEHSAGWDRNKSGDPVFMPLLQDISRRQNESPVSSTAITKYALEQKLDFSPGERFAYSNVGYCILGKVIESTTGKSLIELISREITQPVFGKDYRTGKSVERSDDELTYHSEDQQKLIAAPGIKALLGVEAPYGSYSIENMEAFGSWVATPTDVLKFFLAIDGTKGPQLITNESLASMLESPSYSNSSSLKGSYFGKGIMVSSNTNGKNWFHSGSQPGLEALAIKTMNGFAWVVVFNSRPKSKNGMNFFNEFDRALWRASRNTKIAEKNDLF
jgi:CubicO group peptidase (beta-lactamase class C family)